MQRTILFLWTLGTLAIGTAGWSLAQEIRTTEGKGITVYQPPADSKGVIRYYGSRTWSQNRYVQAPSGYAIVKDWRRIALAEGRSEIRIVDVAKRIEPSTVHFTSLTDPGGTSVVEQDFEYDLVDRSKVLEKYLDREIALLRYSTEEEAPLTGTLLSNDGGMILEVDGKILVNPPSSGGIELPSLPGGLVTRPTLVWRVEARRAGEHLAKITYRTEGIVWMADYTALVREGDSAIDLSAWVTIDNQSGATYDDAQIKLVAGDVHRLPPDAEQVGWAMGARSESTDLLYKRSEGFEEKSFFEYHLYTLGRTSTLKDNSQKQIELFAPVTSVPASKIFVYFGAQGLSLRWSSPQTSRDLSIPMNREVDVYLRFRNSEAAGLGIPLPAGVVRVHKEDEADGSLEFIGEDRIGHTPKDEDVLLRLGSAFDVVGERKQTDFEVDTKRDWMDESFEIKLRNHKEEEVEILVKEVLYRWVNWEITASSHEFRKIDFRTIHFPVKVPPDGEVTVTYTVHYTW